jgi:hypothetical protein
MRHGESCGFAQPVQFPEKIRGLIDVGRTDIADQRTFSPRQQGRIALTIGGHQPRYCSHPLLAHPFEGVRFDAEPITGVILRRGYSFRTKN